MAIDGIKLWHGGAPGRKVGHELLPPEITGLTYTRRKVAIEGGLDKISQRLDRVYVTTDRELARTFASMWTVDGTHHGRGSLYRVQAQGLEPDEDLLSLEGISYQVTQARVIAVEISRVPFDRDRCTRTLTRILAAHEESKDARIIPS